MESYFLAFVPIFVSVDALGMLPLYLSITDSMSAAEKGKLVRHSTITALSVAVAFLFVGKGLFLLLGITFEDFMVAGGAILFILSIRDLLAFDRKQILPDQPVGIVPLAVPLMVGPAVLTSSLILLDTYGLWPTLFSIVANLVLCGLILHFSRFLSALLGETGSRTLTKISSLLLGAIGIMLVRRGLSAIVLNWASAPR